LPGRARACSSSSVPCSSAVSWGLVQPQLEALTAAIGSATRLSSLGARCRRGHVQSIGCVLMAVCAVVIVLVVVCPLRGATRRCPQDVRLPSHASRVPNEAIRRFQLSEHVAPTLMFAAATVGIVVNLYIAFGFRKEGGETSHMVMGGPISSAESSSVRSLSRCPVLWCRPRGGVGQGQSTRRRGDAAVAHSVPIGRKATSFGGSSHQQILRTLLDTGITHANPGQGPSDVDNHLDRPLSAPARWLHGMGRIVQDGCMAWSSASNVAATCPHPR
jgi:hypothetical protein